MDMQHVLGRTWAAEGATALLPLYFLSEKDVILIDTGYAKLDRSGLTHLIDDNGLRLRGIIWSHAHFDHTGHVRYLQKRYGCPAAIQLIEAGISVNPDSYRANYVALTYGKSRQLFLEECFTADIVIGAEDDHLDLCGARFGILQLPGHSAGHIGVVTPDGAAYVGDCLIDQLAVADDVDVRLIELAEPAALRPLAAVYLADLIAAEGEGQVVVVQGHILGKRHRQIKAQRQVGVALLEAVDLFFRLAAALGQQYLAGLDHRRVQRRKAVQAVRPAEDIHHPFHLLLRLGQ